MTRVESTPSTPVVRRQIHLPIPKFSLGRLVKLGFLVIVLWLLVQIARTGVWTIPLVSRFAYTRPEPRAVAVELSTERTHLANRLRDAVGGSVQIADGELTALARAGSSTLHLGVQGLNIANAADQPIEFSFVIPQRHNAIVRIELQPKVIDRKVQFEVSRTRVGMVQVPQWIIGEPTKLLLAAALAPYFSAAPPVQTVQAMNGGLRFSFSPR
ncbi:MAG: hypothetical protein AAB549_01110 [Patescibacteria group bacterium]